MIRADRSAHGIPIEQFYAYYGITRQGYFAAVKRIDKEEKLMEALKAEIIEYRRVKECRAGSRSLYYNLDIKVRYGIGVSKFEMLLQKYQLTLLPQRVRIVTTKSSLQSWNYKNLTNGLRLNSVNMLISGDLTHIRLGRNIYYLFMLTDVYSCRIVGHCLSDRMRKQEAVEALNMWINLRGESKLKNCIHHTDGGSQYFSAMYQNILSSIEAKVSVAKNCLENGYAEQRNGLIKNHFVPIMCNTSLTGAQMEVARIIHFINHERKQEKLGWRSPVEFEQEFANKKGPEFKCFDFTTKSK